jgi:hypothetical protein
MIMQEGKPHWVVNRISNEEDPQLERGQHKIIHFSQGILSSQDGIVESITLQQVQLLWRLLE